MLVVVFQVAMSTMDNPLLKYNAKEYFFKASLCHFIVDELNAKVSHWTQTQTVEPIQTDKQPFSVSSAQSESHSVSPG